MPVASSFDALSPAELKRSAIAEAKGLHADVTWQQVFGPDSDAVKAQQLKVENAVRYRLLKREYEFAIGIAKRPTAIPTEHDF